MNTFLKSITLALVAASAMETSTAQQLSFNNFSHVSGSDLQAGSAYRFHNVTSGVDAVVEVTSLTNASLLRIDDSPVATSTNDNAAWRPIVSGVSSRGQNELHYADFTVRFFANASNTPINLDNLTMSIFDTDGDNDRGDFYDGEDGNVIEFAQVSGFTSLLSAGSHLNVVNYADGSILVGAKDSTTNDGVTDAAPWLSVWELEGKNAFSIRLGWSGTDYKADIDNDRLYGVYFNGENTPVIVPEPSSTLMTLLGTLPLIMRRKRYVKP